LDQLRKREYGAAEGSLLMRPLRLTDQEGDWRSWETFGHVAEEFRREGGDWAGRRNKVKALRDALRQGREAVQVFLHTQDSMLPDIRQRPDMKSYGWQGKECGYFDVIEALDFYVPLKGGNGA
jgi:hypothetical protein